MAADHEDLADIEIADWAERLRRYRRIRKLKQSSLAEDLGVTQAMISRWESGRAMPGRAMRARLGEMTEPDPATAPMIGWREFVSQNPTMAGVVSETGIVETVSEGVLRELGAGRDDLEGRHIADILDGDFVALFDRLSAEGLFEGRIAGAETASTVCFRRRTGGMTRLHVHGLHWSRRDKDGDMRWIACGAPVDEEEFLSLCSDLGGQIEIILER